MIPCAEDGNLDVPSSVIEARLASMPKVPDEEWTIRYEEPLLRHLSLPYRDPRDVRAWESGSHY